MALYFLDYDLRKVRNYDTLYAALKDFAAVRVLESSWCFNRFNATTSGIRDYFRAHIDADDGLSVVEVSDWSTWNALGTPKNLA
jgi:hypothetical protein